LTVVYEEESRVGLPSLLLDFFVKSPSGSAPYFVLVRSGRGRIMREYQSTDRFSLGTVDGGDKRWQEADGVGANILSGTSV